MASGALRRFGATVWIWYLIPLHVLSTLVFTSLMIFVLDGATFSSCDAVVSWPRSWMVCGLSQTDVTSLISAGLVLQRLLTSSWVTQSSWIAMYFMLEKEGVTLAEAARLISWHFPAMPRSVRRVYTLAILLVSLLLIPPQYIAPLASGSVAWIPTQLYTNGTVVEVSAANLTSLWWQTMQIQEHRFELSAGAVARSVQIQDDDMFTVGTPGELLLKRRLATLKSFPNGTVLENVTMPYISIESFNWIPLSNFTMLPSWVTQVLGTSNLTLDFSTGQSPSRITSEGIATIPKAADFTQSSWYKNLPAPPPPTTFSGAKYVTLLVRRINEVCTCPSWSPTFGPIKDLVVYDLPFYHPANTCFADSCFAIAEMQMTTGQTVCKNCRLVQSGVVELRSSSPEKDGISVQPDPWVDVIFDMLPEVMSMMTVMNTTDAPEFDNPEGYLRGFVSQAYQSSWNSITDLLSYSEVAGHQNTITTTASVPRPAIKASISKSRMITWLCLNLLLTVAGVLLVTLQQWSHRSGQTRPLGQDFVADALLASPNELLEQQGTQHGSFEALKSAKIISEPDKRFNTLRLRLVHGHQGDVGSRQGSYRKIIRNPTVLQEEMDDRLLVYPSEQWEMRSRNVSTTEGVGNSMIRAESRDPSLPRHRSQQQGVGSRDVLTRDMDYNDPVSLRVPLAQWGTRSTNASTEDVTAYSMVRADDHDSHGFI